jgi:hypothetical protein
MLAECLRRYLRSCDVLDDETIVLLFKSAPLHDIGNVETGPAHRAGMGVMKYHCAYGCNAVAQADHGIGAKSESFLRYAVIPTGTNRVCRPERLRAGRSGCTPRRVPSRRSNGGYCRGRRTIRGNGAMKEIAEAVRSILDKVGDFFNILDLSFIVAGSAAFGALALWVQLGGNRVALPQQGWLGVFGILMGCYLLGLVCFAAGRLVRTGFYTRRRQDSSQTRFAVDFPALLKAHGLDEEEPFKTYIARGEAGTWRLYTRLWAEVREKRHPSPSVSLLNRYWVMAATYDGLTVATGVWLLVVAAWSLGLGVASPLDGYAGTAAIVLLVVVGLACRHEAERYTRYQAEELVATIAAMRKQ